MRISVKKLLTLGTRLTSGLAVGMLWIAYLKHGADLGVCIAFSICFGLAHAWSYMKD